MKKDEKQQRDAGQAQPPERAVEKTGEGEQPSARREVSPPATQAETPFTFMRRYMENMERLFDDFKVFGTPSLFGRESVARNVFAGGGWWPQIEVTEREGQFIVRADLPGMTKDDVKVEVHDGALSITGERKQESEEEREGYFRSERSYGSFYRRVPLPEGADVEKAEASFNNGVLEVKVGVPKRESNVRRVEIKESAAEKPLAKAAGK